MTMDKVFSCVVGRECLLWPVHCPGKTLLPFALLHSVLQGQICLLLQVFLDFLLLHSSPLEWKGHLFWVLVLKGLVGLHSREGNGTPLQYSCLEDPMDGGAWKAAVHGVAEGRTWLSDFTFTSLSCIGEGNGNPLQCSCLENPRDGGACWAAVYGVTQSRTRLKQLSSSRSS